MCIASHTLPAKFEQNKNRTILQPHALTNTEATASQHTTH